ncbi:probable G-protein coupled receptor 158 isoform X2 [Drosophila rhopaloa]|uniref:G-protein coupled receptors family 3 profile domain-containing protein n=1 Tax=Drosophila rhopaloa TaxID=1041015 RepID=A0ABM5J9Y8_DRORH|nr:probable G-protein coupled receptor 158 isoform X2 [Drosophila rhopaloa]
MELCIATKSKTEIAQSSMQQSNYYQKKCHQNQTNTQVQSTQQSNCSSHRDRDHLTKQQQNQRTNSATATSSHFKSNISSSTSSNISSSYININRKSSKNSSKPSRSTQLNTLYSLLVLLIVGLATAAASPSPHATPFSRESRRDALLAYYKRAHLQQSSDAPAPAPASTFLGHKHQYHLHHDASGLDFDELTPTVSVVSVLSRAERFRLRKRSATPTTPATVADTAATSPVAAATSPPAAATPKTEEKCEPKVLETQPDEPFYDYTDIAEDAARQFIEFLSSKFPNANTPITIDEATRAEVSRRANGIASYALNEDDNLLAFAIAAPSIHTVVVKFKDNVTIPPNQVRNKAYLGSYWRELGAAWNSTDGTQEWGAPFRDCNLLTRRWLWPFRISFSEHKIKVVAAAFIAADEDVCNDGLEEVFGRRHGCDRNTTFCLLTENKPAATRDVYTCLCRESYYLPNSTLQGFRGDRVELSEGYDNYSCIPCPGGCSNCDNNGVCLTFQEEEVLNVDACLRLLVAIVLGACILCCVVLGVIVFRQRKCKAIASGMWTVLETILLGIVLLYASVAVHFFPASTERCLLEPWLRELGFITCYGAIILKLYRHLVDFRTRKAHRWVLRDVDLLKYLGTMVFAVICYMAAFTASSLDLLESAQLESLREADTNTCHPLKWELVTQTSEMLILCFGLHLSIASRNANTQFRERQFLVTALTLEFLVSSSFYFLRFVYLPEMSPSAILLALFIRSQLTNSFALGLIFVPKLWYQHKQVRSLAYDLSIRLPVDAFKGTSHDAGQRLGGGYAGLCLGDPDIGELTISEMSPEDIRAELKRLYTQLEIMKSKTLRQDNPHISKRRGGRKAGHRRFSLQALSAKHRSNKHHQDIEITEAEPSRTPEDSVCSAEGPTDTYAEISGVSHSMLSHSMVSHSVVSHSK